MKLKSFLSLLTLGLLAGALLWQTQAQPEPIAPPATTPPEEAPPTESRRRVVLATAPSGMPGNGFDYKLVVQPLPAQKVFPESNMEARKAEASKPQELEVLKDYPGWEIAHAELLPQYPGYTPPHGTYGAWPAMVYTLRKPR